MQNLSAVLQTYFIDANVDEVIHSTFAFPSRSDERPLYQGMSQEKFTQNFLKHNSMYGTDVIGSIHKLANDYWLFGETSKKRNVFNILTTATKEMLLWENDEPYCNYKDFLRWNEISSILGEDLLITAFLAKKTVEEKLRIKSFAWKPHIISQNQDLNTILQKGLSELHYHMQGSSLGFDVNWLSLMNSTSSNAYFQKKLENLDEDFYFLIEKARIVRFCLFSYVRKDFQENGLFQNMLKVLVCKERELTLFTDVFNSKIDLARHNALKISEESIDYAINDPISNIDQKRFYNIALIGERKLLYNAFKNVFSSDENFEKYLMPLYVYVLIKNKFRRILEQNDGVKGFSHFQNIQGRKKLFFKPESIYAKLFDFLSLQNTIGNQPIKFLEMRIAPENKAKKYRNSLVKKNERVNDLNFCMNGINPACNKKVKAGYIIHFFKEMDRRKDPFTDSLCCRNSELRSRIQNQANAIASMLEGNDEFVKGGVPKKPTPKQSFFNEKEKSIHIPIIGIDAASSEFGCRPEVFASVFRQLSNVSRNCDLDFCYDVEKQSLGRTFHVGEDFYDIVDGLRAIDECIFFLNFKHGDRLGHAIALGEDAKEYYSTRDYKIILPKQILLDNAVWMINKMEEYSIQDCNGLIKRLKDVFYLYFNDIYHTTKASIEEYYLSWKLRGDHPTLTSNSDQSEFKPYLKNKITPELDIIRKNQSIVNLYRQYHYDAKAKAMGDQCVQFNFEESDAIVIDALQKAMQKKIALEKIAIETNPSSNYRITDVSRFAYHPITKFNNHGLVKNPSPYQIKVSINTDDQGVFATSLEKEFTLIALALEKERDANGNPLYSPKDIYHWLDEIRESAKISSFFN